MFVIKNTFSSFFFALYEKTLIAAGLLSILSLLFCASCEAQTWKPLCVDGGGSQGAHNGTWQKLNSATAGGGTWKILGGCGASLPTITAGQDSSSVGYRNGVLGSYGPMGSMPNANYKGATIYEIAQYGVAIEITFIGSLPINFFNSVSINSVTYNISQCSGSNSSCNFNGNFMDGGRTYSTWNFFQPSSGISNGNIYPVSFN